MSKSLVVIDNAGRISCDAALAVAVDMLWQSQTGVRERLDREYQAHQRGDGGICYFCGEPGMNEETGHTLSDDMVDQFVANAYTARPVWECVDCACK